MKAASRFIAVSQRVVEIPGRNEVRDCLDQAWTKWLQALGLTPLPVPNCLTAASEFLAAVRPAGIILSGGNNLALPVYDGVEGGVIKSDAYASRDNTEHVLVDFALEHQIPLLGCCRGMQFLHAYFGGRLTAVPATEHVAHEHGVDISHGRFRTLAGGESLRVNSFHNYGIASSILPAPLVPFAISKSDSTVEGFFHEVAPVVGVMWHPERSNPAKDFDYRLAQSLFNSTKA